MGAFDEQESELLKDVPAFAGAEDWLGSESHLLRVVGLPVAVASADRAAGNGVEQPLARLPPVDSGRLPLLLLKRSCACLSSSRKP